MPKQVTLTSEILQVALAGLEAQKQRIEEQLEEVRAMLGIRADGAKRRGRPPKSATVAEAALVPGKRRRFSAETRAKMAAAQKKRWIAIKKESDTPAKPAAKKRKLSAAGRKRIIEATKKRWAEYHAKKAAS